MAGGRGDVAAHIVAKTFCARLGRLMVGEQPSGADPPMTSSAA
jgi:hypothetical protein